MSKVTSPYGFVPVSEHVYFPAHAGIPAADVPFRDGVWGTVQVTVEAETPIFVRGDGSTFFQLPDGTFAIPGSSLRGGIRNAVEIASFGKLGRVNDQRYGVRDLQNQDVYVRHMAGVLDRADGGKREPMPLVNAGWLVKRGGAGVAAEIEICDFYKLEYDRFLEPLCRERGCRLRPGDRQSAPRRYRDWGDERGDHATRGLRAEVREDRAQGPCQPSRYGKVTAVGGRGLEGTIVFTGQPMNRHRGDKRKKHHDFLFVDQPGRRVSVTKQVFDDFRFIHSDRGQQNRDVTAERPNEEWGFWKKVFDEGGKVPVFFLLEEQGGAIRLRAIGLAMMFRLAYRKTTGDAVRNAQPAYKDPDPDLAELIFGTVGSTSGPQERRREARARRGRVSFSLLRAQGAPRPDPTEARVLSAPKPTFYPAYVEQSPVGQPPGMKAANKDSYRTYMDDDVRVRGWKRFRPQDVWKGPPLQKPSGGKMDTSDIESRFAPLPAGTRFTGTMRLHNLLPEEIGALLWVLTWGGDETCRHLLGLARPFGFGRVRIEVGERSLQRNLDGAPVSSGQVQEALAAFEQRMEEFAARKGIEGGWSGSLQIRELKALARPLPSGSKDGRYPSIGRGPRDNEFVAIKKAGAALSPVSWPQRVAPARGRPGRSKDDQRASGGGSRDGRQGRGHPGGRRQQGRPAPSTERISWQPHVGKKPSASPDKGSSKKSTAFAGLKSGVTVEVEAVSQSRKGKWRVRLIDGSGEGLVHGGRGPEDLVKGGRATVVFQSGGNPMDLSFSWPK